MRIAPELLSEKNYEGSRLVEVNNETINDMQKQLQAIVDEITPINDKLSEQYYKVVDPWYQEAQAKRLEVNELKAKIKAVADQFQTDVEFIEKKGQEAQLIKDKMVPIINDVVGKDLGEFEKAMQTVVKGDKLFVEVVDEIEEKVKAIRASKKK